MRRIVATLVVLGFFIPGCATTESRRNAWESKLRTDLPPGTRVESVLNWVHANYLDPYGQNQNVVVTPENKIELILETYYRKGLDCNRWRVGATISLNAEDKVSSVTVVAAPDC